MQTEQHEIVRRRDNIPESIRTPGKDDAALVIENEIANGNWPLTPSELAERSDWSRSHMRNVLDQYFEPVDENGDPVSEHENGAETDGKMNVKVGPEPDRGISRTVRIDIPANVTNAVDYMRGYVDAKRDDSYR